MAFPRPILVSAIHPANGMNKYNKFYYKNVYRIDLEVLQYHEQYHLIPDTLALT